MKSKYKLLTCLKLIWSFSFLLQISATLAQPVNVKQEPLFEVWPQDPEFIRLVTSVPNLNALDPSMFRYVFGAMPVRLSLTEGGAQMLVIGQDGTHGAEVSGQPFNGAGTGGRGQHMVYYVTGNDEGVYMNTFTYTIRKQYGDFAPMLINGEVQNRSLLPPATYLLAQDPSSPLVQWRNAMIDYILRKNPNIEIILGYGRAANDSIATYLESKNVSLDQRIPNKVETLKYDCTSAGGNMTFCYPTDAQGNSLLLPASDKISITSNRAVPLMQQYLADKNFVAQNVIPKLQKVPVVFPGQFGKNLKSMNANFPNVFDLNLNGQVRRIFAASGPHPGAVAGGTDAKNIEAAYQAIFRKIIAAKQAGLIRLPFMSELTRNIPYKYGHREIPRNKFAASQKTYGASTDASRSGPQIINFGGREHPVFDAKEKQAALLAVNSNSVSQWIQQGNIPWDSNRSEAGVFHRPDYQWASFLVNSLRPIIGTPRQPGAIYNVVGNSPIHGYFGVYRGSAHNAQVVILTDNSLQDLDDMITGMALSGPYGRNLQGFLNKYKSYLIFNLLPFDMKGKNVNFEKALALTESWRNQVIQQIRINNPQATFFALGAYAEKLFPTANPIRDSMLSVPMDIPRIDLPAGTRQWMGRGNASSVIRSTNFPGVIYGWVAPNAVAGAVVPMTLNERAFRQKVAPYLNFKDAPRHGSQDIDDSSVDGDLGEVDYLDYKNHLDCFDFNCLKSSFEKLQEIAI